jgi:hypothetical protein
LPHIGGSQADNEQMLLAFSSVQTTHMPTGG